MTNKTLRQLYEDHHGKVSDKWSIYLREYDRLFSEYRGRPVNLLEIGIQNGGSLEIWSHYFPLAGKIVGCDINPDCERLTYADSRIAVVVANANTDEAQSEILTHAPVYDLIIDDGSHRSSDIIHSFSRYFPHLMDGGLFVVEDIHCSYWGEFEGGLFDPYSSMAFFKRLADVINHEHWGVARTRNELLKGFAGRYGLPFAEDTLSQVRSIEFINSLCVIRKAARKTNELGSRVIVGEIELVETDIKKFHHATPMALDQSWNQWSTRTQPVDEQFASMAEELNWRDSVVTTFDKMAIDVKEQIAGLRHVLVESGITQLAALSNDVVNLRQALDVAVNDLKDRHETIAALEKELTTRNEELNGLEDRLAERNRTLAHHEIQIGNLESQRHILSAEVFRLNAEAARFGAKIGRGITQLRGKIAPVGTVRGKVAGLGARFGSKLVSEGLRGASSATYRYVAVRVRSKLSQKASLQPHEVTGAAQVFEIPGERGVKADHPQLAAWIARNELSAEKLKLQADEAKALHYCPLLSVIVPIYKVPRDVLVETLSCLLDQTYTNWEACVVWSHTEDVEGWKWLCEHTKDDSRFKIELLEVNGGISRNSNAALELAQGEYIVLLDHDDTIAPCAFFEVVKLLQTSPHLDFIYSDKDCIDAAGHIRLNALFKPGWSPEMLHSVNYLTHLNIMRTSLVREVGGWNPETDGAQDWDIFFRVSEKTRHIARISSILYHWRILPTSTATGLAAKPYAAMGQFIAQQNFFSRRGLPATVMPTVEGLFHVKWPVDPESTDVFVLQTGSVAKLKKILDLLRARPGAGIRKVHLLHDDHSKTSFSLIKKEWGDRLNLHCCKVVDWRSALTAICESDATGPLVLLDGSAESISEDLIEELSGWVNHHPEIAWAGAIAMNPDGTVFEAGRVVSADYQSAPLFRGSPLFSFGWFGGPLWYRNVRAVSPYAIAFDARDARRVLTSGMADIGAVSTFAEFCVRLLGDDRRGVINPFARIYFKTPLEADWPNDGDLYRDDPYFSPVFDKVSPLRLRS